MSLVQGLHHVQITIPKGAEERAREFYCGVLGLAELQKPATLAGRGGFWLDLPGIQVHVGVEDGFDRTRTKAHLAYEVHDLERASDALRAVGLEILHGPEIPGLRRFETRDPFGNRIELVQRVSPPVTVSSLNPKSRFSDRVANYVKYRPSYPAEVLTFMKKHLGVSQESKIADAGSGTGIFSALLLTTGATIYGIEPNDEMRQAAENMLKDSPNFCSLKGSAEETGLPDLSIDIVAAAQAFHWFDQHKAKAEFRRVLRSGGYIALIWNERQDDRSDFAEQYERLIQKFGTDYAQVAQRNINQTDVISKFFAPKGFAMERFANHQDFDFEGLKGRLLSASYAPNEQHQRYREMLTSLQHLFDQHQTNGKIRLDYDTQLYWGQLE